MKIDLAPPLADLVRQKVESGRYRDEAEVVADALRLLDELDQRKLDALLKAIDEGEADFENGRYVVVRTDEELRALFANL
jgi:putative addiction module CopG family antidote